MAYRLSQKQGAWLTSMYLPGLVFHSKPAAPLTVVNGITLALSSNRFSPLPKPAKEHLAMPQTYLQDMHGGSCSAMGRLVPSAWTRGCPLIAAAEGVLGFATGTLAAQLMMNQQYLHVPHLHKQKKEEGLQSSTGRQRRLGQKNKMRLGQQDQCEGCKAL
ncbi:MAG: hypothetical protein FRX49_10999 [Trebouxia sp. A1-2]|nr:MAG: hypothetical protein FRX49_10999 [Trebouxia sp. A1-2]